MLDTVRDRVTPHLKQVIDLFATPLTAAHYVELVNPLWSSRRLQARVEDVRDETRDARTLVLRPGRNWRRHRAGQHIRVGLSVDGRRYTRTYSISSSPDRPDGNITITVKILEGGRMSRHLVREVEPGDHLPIGLPQGEFVIPEARPVRPLFITGGSGITPIMSMIRSYDIIGNVPDIVHVHYAPHAYDAIFRQECEDLAERHHGLYTYRPVHTRELGTGEVADDRHFSAEQLAELCPDWERREVWACGPQGLLDAVEQHFGDAGRSRRVHVERFRAAMADVEDAEGGDVTFRVDGDEVHTEAAGDVPLLRVAEDAGLNPPHGCRMGICHSCDSPLRSGRVRDLRTGEVHGETDQMVQTCITAAAGDCTIELENR